MKILKTISIILMCLMLACSTVYAEDEREIIPATDENIVYTGRWSENDKGVMCGTFECSAALRFTGTSIGTKGGSGNIFVSVDGSEPKSVSLPLRTIAKDLNDGEHVLRIYAAAQTAFPKIASFTLDKGAKILPFGEHTTIEFIGDSILEGYVEPGNNSVINTYGHIVAEHFGWERNTVAFGGITLTAGYGNPDSRGMINRYFLDKEFVSGKDEPGEWDTSKFTPDVIVINLGTNDNGVSDTEFALAYSDFVRKLRDAYTSPIFIMKPLQGRKSNAIDTAEKLINAENVFFIDSGAWDISMSADNLHPSVDGHKQMAEKLIAELEKYLDKSGKLKPTETPSPSEAPAPDSTNDANKGSDGKSDDNKNGSGSNGSNILVPIICVSVAVIVIAAVIIIIIKKKRNNI